MASQRQPHDAGLTSKVFRVVLALTVISCAYGMRVWEESKEAVLAHKMQDGDMDSSRLSLPAVAHSDDQADSVHRAGSSGNMRTSSSRTSFSSASSVQDGGSSSQSGSKYSPGGGSFASHSVQSGSSFSARGGQSFHSSSEGSRSSSVSSSSSSHMSSSSSGMRSNSHRSSSSSVMSSGGEGSSHSQAGFQAAAASHGQGAARGGAGSQSLGESSRSQASDLKDESFSSKRISAHSAHASRAHSSVQSQAGAGSSAEASKSMSSSGDERSQRAGSRESHGAGREQADAQHSSGSANVRAMQSQASRDSSASSNSSRSAAARVSSNSNSGSSRESSSSRGMSALDSEQRNYFRELISRRCKDCVVNGTRYNGHSRFEYTDGCKRYRCVCSCDGSYTCPPRYALDVCKDGQDGSGGRQRNQQRRRRCQTCQALGQEFPGNAYFDVQDGCTKYRGCICYCNGTWTCPSERAVDTCRQESTTTPLPTTVSPCRACTAKGKVVAANSYFELEEPCRRYRSCRCHCNGTWECPSQFAEDTCQSPTMSPEDARIPGCQTCSALNKTVAGNSYFEVTQGCIEYRNCVCRCNGSWTCPPQYARNVCTGQDASADRSKARQVPDSSAECQSCNAYGRYFRGNTYFNTRNGCIGYDRCVCRCDGSWDCPTRFRVNLCQDDDPNNDVDNANETCSYCNARGKIIPSNSLFNMTLECVEHSQCLCHCDGAWICPERFSRNICGAAGQTLPPRGADERGCSSCIVDSRVVRGNTYFDRVSECFRYRDCLCKCDGTYQCRQDRAENICIFNRTASSSSSSSSASSSSSSGSASQSAGSGRYRPSCLRCMAFGQLRAPNSRFVYEESCVEYECDCHCNGTYTCSQDSARRTCDRGCRECELGGQFFEGNTYFKHKQGCIEYLCTCFCNGTYDCPANRANNTCAASGSEDIASAGTVTDVSKPSGGQCIPCTADNGRSYQPNTDFTLNEGCIHYQCRCNCDGSWNCPGETARNLCRGETLGGCRSCVISESQIYHGDDDFQMRKGCIHYMCRCHCNGSWECPGEQARDICLGEVPGGCRVCRVSQNETYRGGSQFQLRQGCNHYQCNCHCNGSWECPGETARDVCIGEVPGGCRVCKLAGGEIYRGESDFQLVKNCIHYDCRCNCDGGWNCPGEKARWICNADGTPIRDGARLPPTSPVTTAAPVPQCFRCVVSDGEQFTPNRPFTLRRGCNVYRCQCECDGSWNCPADRSWNICSRRDSPELRAQTCSSCRVSSYTYPGSSSFLLTRGCSQYNCQCDCSGRWTCNHTVARNICQDRERASPYSSSGGRDRSMQLTSVSSASLERQAQSSIASDMRQKAVSSARGVSVSAANLGSSQRHQKPAPACRPCRVQDREYTPEMPFTIDKKCKRFNCYCSCNGRWRCPRNRVVDLCPEDQNPSGRGRQASGASDGRRYGQTNVRVIGASSAASSSSSSSFSASSSSEGASEVDQNKGRLRVHGYYVNSGQQVAGQEVGSEESHQSAAARERQRHAAELAAAEERQKQAALLAAAEERQRQSAQLAAARERHRQAAQLAAAEERQRLAAELAAAEERQRQAAQLAAARERQRLAAQLAAAEERQKLAAQIAAAEERRKQAGQRGGHSSQAQEGQEIVVSHRRAEILSGPTHEREASQAGAAVSYESGSQNSRQVYEVRAGAEERYHAANQNGQHSSSSAASVVSVGGQARNGSGDVSCTPCLVDEKVYRTGAKFNWRRGCVVYKCSCLCSGSYRCRISVDPNCTEEAGPGTGGLPTGPAVGGQPAGQPGGACGNCYMQGFVYPGNMSFTLRQGCQELSCRCRCDGSHECEEQKLIPGCTAVSTPLVSAGYPYGSAPAVYPVGGGAYAVRPGRVINTFQHTVHSVSSCPSCQPHGQTGGGVLYPFVSAGQDPSGIPQVPPHSQDRQDQGAEGVPMPVWPVLQMPHKPSMGHGQSHGGMQVVPMRPVDGFDPSVLQDGHMGKKCASCYVNDRFQRGSFEYIDNCYHVTCYCDCTGLLRCSVQQARTANCRAPEGPVSGQCRSCVVQSHEYPPNLDFALRVGCHDYECTCGCDGVWVCPTQQPKSYCILPVRPPERVAEDRYHVAAQGEQGIAAGGSSHHSHAGGVAGLQDVTFSRSAPLSEDSMLSCRDCDVRGTVYPSNTRFLLKDGCLQHTCDCACDGNWACVKALTVDVCQVDQSQDMLREQEAQEAKLEAEQERRQQQEGKTMADHKRALAELAAHRARIAASHEDCRSCQVNDKTYLTNSDFQFRQDCYLYTCHCFCNGSWDCPDSKTLNICSSSDYGADGCRQCHIGDKTFPGGADFSYNDGCWEFSCHCGCNGHTTCPPEKSRNSCEAGDGQALREGPGVGAREAPSLGASCKPCTVDGQVIRPRSTFNKRVACTEFLCHCDCNGTWACPSDRSFNFCNIQEGQTADQGAADLRHPPPKGCKVGRKTYFTRLFAFTDGCMQHMCICYDNGSWRCPRGKGRRIC